MLFKYFLPASNIFVIKYEISPSLPSPGCKPGTRDTAPAIEVNIVIITHTAHIGVFSPRLVSELPVIMTRGHEVLAAATKAQNNRIPPSPRHYMSTINYGRYIAAGRCREYLALSHTPLQFLCHSMLASVLLQSACNHTIVIGKIIDKMLSI